MGEVLDQGRIRRLLQVGRSLVAELDPDAVLDRVLETAIEITGARYAAIGVLDLERARLERFVTRGIDEETQRAIGDLPRGRGVLGVLIEEPRPLRLADVGRHPKSYGFPAGHPPMRSFLGVPVVIRGEAWGNLYLAEKQGADFDKADEQAAVILAEWAAIAIENARLYQTSESRRVQLEQALRAAESSRDIALAIGAELELARVLELIAKRGRALVGARSLVILLREGDELMVVASAGYADGAHGLRLAIESLPRRVIERQRAERIIDMRAHLGIDPKRFGVADARSALIVPLIYKEATLGLLCAFDCGDEGQAFSEDHEQLLRAFAASAATAVAMAQSVQAERLRHSLAAADAERRRWARELHDETLQGLASVRVLLASALRQGDLDDREHPLRQAIAQIEQEIGNLRAIIAELRPAALDELGLASAIGSLVERHRARGDFEIDAVIDLPDQQTQGSRADPDVEATIYRVVQEALTNVAKHAHAQHVRVVVRERAGEVALEVSDDGRGFHRHSGGTRFGLTGMRERVNLAHGVLEVDSSDEGTRLRARLPLHPAEELAGASSSGVEHASS